MAKKPEIFLCPHCRGAHLVRRYQCCQECHTPLYLPGEEMVWGSGWVWLSGGERWVYNDIGESNFSKQVTELMNVQHLSWEEAVTGIRLRQQQKKLDRKLKKVKG